MYLGDVLAAELVRNELPTPAEEDDVSQTKKQRQGRLPGCGMVLVKPHFGVDKQLDALLDGRHLPLVAKFSAQSGLA
jgi:hypothetical protein